MATGDREQGTGDGGKRLSRRTRTKRNQPRARLASAGGPIGQQVEIKLTVEQLEPRAMLAGDTGVAAAAGDALGSTVDTTMAAETPQVRLTSDGSPLAPYASFDGPVVALALQITTPDGSPVGDLHVGDDFVLHVLAQDLRTDPHGVFAVYMDIDWDAALAESAGALTYSAEYESGEAGDLSTPGQLDEAGAFSGPIALSGGLHEVFSVPMHAVATGQLVFSTDPADLMGQHDILIYGENDSIDPVDIVFGGAAVTISDASPGDAGPQAGGDPSSEQPALPPVDDASLLPPVDRPEENASIATVAPALLTVTANLPAEDDVVVPDDNSTPSETVPIEKSQPEPEEDLLTETLLPKRD